MKYIYTVRTKFPVILRKKHSDKIVLFNKIFKGTVVSYGENGREKGFDGRRWLYDESNSDYIPFDGEIRLTNELLRQEDGYTCDRIFCLKRIQLVVIGDPNGGSPITSLCETEDGRFKIGDVLLFDPYFDGQLYCEELEVILNINSTERVVYY